MTDEERMLWTENGRLQGRVGELEAEIERLRAGGCARDQGTTQYCAEAAMKDAEIQKLLTTLADERTESMRLRAALAEAGCDHCRHWFDRAALEEGRT